MEDRPALYVRVGEGKTGWRSRWTQKRRSKREPASAARTTEGEVSRVSFPELLYNFVLNSTPD